ncbi:MAG: serine/threonine-protein kinase [Acidobacteriota bacterium]|nr:serine/threonine-protein kinase [Acidobacteriota bacterium]
MTIEPGQTLLHYRLTEKIGEGGMGVVWKALDTTLDREVAIKVLPAAFAGNAERLARFEREAKLLASLNHPNLATVFGVHRSDDTRFLAMELVPGEDLAQRISRGRLSIEEVIGIAGQVARALEAAHGRGVVHRDLKPANIRVTPDGTVKILDFGLAKTLEAESGDPSLSPTMTSVGSVAGMLLGTAGYMSPEQARGQDVDERSDIWSFGCVLWECLTQQVLFGGKTVSDSIGAILHTEPDWTRLPEGTTPALRRLLQRCLSKDPRHRLHHIADARIELEATDPDLPSVVRSSRGYWIAIAVLAIAATTALTAALWPTADKAEAEDANPLAGARFTRVTDFPGAEYDAAISPDGRFVTFVSDRDGPFQLYVGQIGAGDFRKLNSDDFTMDDARAAVRSVGFNSDGSEIWLGGGPLRRVRMMPLLGGSVRNFLSEESVTVAWSPDGTQIVYHERVAGDPLYIADSNETNSRKILSPPAGTHQHYPVWSADGLWIYMARGRPATLEMDLWRVRVNGEDLEQVTHGKLDVRSPTPIDANTVLYSARDTDGAGPWLWALDVRTGVSRRASIGLEQYASISASANGRRLVVTVQDARSTLWSVPIQERPATEGDAQPITDLQTPRALSPRFGGSSMFYLSSRGSGDGLWRYSGGKPSEIWRGSKTALLEPAAVSPDGETVVLLLRNEERWRLHTLGADGTRLRLLSETIDARGAAAWSPDGKWIVTGGYEAGVEGLFKIPVGGGAAERIVDGEALNPVWSPEGNLIAYTGAQVNVVTPLLAVRPDGEPVRFPEIDLFRWGQRARFLPDGTGLVYMQGQGSAQDFWLLDLTTLRSRRLTELGGTDTMMSFDVTPDGSRIVFDRLRENVDVVLIELKRTD